MKFLQFTLPLIALLLTACHSIDRYEWVGPQSLKGSGGMMKVEDGLEIWVAGEPQREYVPVKVVETMTSGTIGVETYLFRVLKNETKKLGGDGFILLTKDAQTGGYYATGTALTTTTGSIYGNSYTGTSFTSGSAVAVPIRYNTYRALVFRYKQ